ncbi:MAG TPA: hypothetical protein VJV79_37305 [Polyangiaceae bacterium]|nr:hypothetical protein [Polyangiaceae bacterium]
MPIPENFKYDVRVRERMLKRGLLTESELSKHVDALADVTDQVVEVELKQPALVKESERVERVVSRSAPRPVVAHVPVVRSLENELNDIDDDEDDDLDDEDDEDEDDVKVKAAAKVAAAEKAAAAAPAVVAEPAPAAEPTPEAEATEEDAESDT